MCDEVTPFARIHLQLSLSIPLRSRGSNGFSSSDAAATFVIPGSNHISWLAALAQNLHSPDQLRGNS
jgi:hypothetical protein